MHTQNLQQHTHQTTYTYIGSGSMCAEVNSWLHFLKKSTQLFTILFFTVFFFMLFAPETYAVSTGERFPTLGTTVSESPWSDNSWASPTNIYADNSGTSATANVLDSTFDTNDQSYVLKATGFDFSSIPDGSTINGITVKINSWYRSAAGSGSIDLCQLLDVSRAKVGTNNCSTPTALTTTDTTVITYGGSSDLWGNALTVAWLKDPDFGVALGALSTALNTDVDIDYVTIEVTYTEPTASQLSLSGTLYSDEGTTPLTGTSHTIKVAVGTSSTPNVQTTTSSSGNGTWSFSNVEAMTRASAWTASSASEANSWQSITYGNGTFVAISSDGANRVMTSTNGITWTARSAAEANSWQSVTYGGGIFVAVSNDGTNRVMTSSDNGATWSPQSAASALSWQSVTYGTSTFVAVAAETTSTSTAVMTSTNGTAWTSRAAAEANSWKSVVFTGTRYVAVSSDGLNQVMTSATGTSWTARAEAQANSWQSVAYGNGLLVAVSSDGVNRTMTSSDDGSTWSVGTQHVSEQTWDEITFAEDRFVAVANGGTNTIMTSPDGLRWTARNAPNGNNWESVVYGNGLFVAVSATTTGTSTAVATADSGIFEETPFTFWIDGHATDATTFMEGVATGTITGIPLYAATVVAYGASSTASSYVTDMTDMYFYDSTDDADILYTASSASIATSTANFIVASSTKASTTASLILNSSFTNRGTLRATSSTFYLKGSSKTISGKNLTGSSTLGNLVVSGSYSVSSARASTTDFTINTGGSFTAPSTAMSVGGDFVQNGSFDDNNGTLYFDAEGFIIEGATSLQNSNVGFEDGSPNGMTVSSDGTLVFMLGLNGDDVWSYYLSTPWDISTQVLNGTFDMSAQDTAVTGIAFSTDGTKMYMVGNANDKVFQYSLTSAYAVSSAVFVASTSISSEETTPEDITFSQDGTKMYIVGAQSNEVNQYSLTTPFDITTKAFVYALSISAQSSNPLGVVFSTNGSKMFVISPTGDNVYEYSLTTPYVVSTAMYTGTVLNVTAEDGNPTGLAFSSDGSILFIVGAGDDDFYQYTLHSPQSISGTLTGSSNLGNVTFTGDLTPTFNSRASTTNFIIDTYSFVQAPTTTLSVAGNITNNGTFTVATNTTIYLTGASKTLSGVFTDDSALNDVVVTGSYTLSNNATTSDVTIRSGGSLAVTDSLTINGNYSNSGTFTHSSTSPKITFDDVVTSVSAFVYDTSYNVHAEEQTPEEVRFNPLGTKMFVLGNSGNDISEFTLATPFEVSSASYVDATSTATYETSPRGMAFNADGTKLYFTGDANDTIYQYNMSTAYDVSTASYGGSKLVSAEDTFPTSVAFNNTGTKVYILGDSGNDVNQYSVSTPFDISSTVTFLNLYDGSAVWGATPRGLAFNTDGTHMYVTGSANIVYDYKLLFPFDTYSAVYDSQLTVTSAGSSMTGVTLGRNLYVTSDDAGTSNVGQFKLNTAYATGTLNGSSELGDIEVDAERVFTLGARASTTDLTVGTTYTMLTAPTSSLSIAGNYTNSGVFDAQTGKVYFNGTTQQTATGTMTGTSAFYKLNILNTSQNGSTSQAVIFGRVASTTNTFTMVASTSAQFRAGATSTFQNIDFAGASLGVRQVFLRSSTGGSKFFIDTDGTKSVYYANIKDSGACGSAGGGITATSSTNAGNNTCWTFVNPVTAGTLVLADHVVGQVDSTFTFQNKTDEPIFAFNLDISTESVTVSNLVVSLTGLKKIDATKLSGITLHRDLDNDGLYDATDTQIGGSGVLAITGQTGTITFGTSFTATTAQNYIIIADITAITNNSYVTLDINTTGITATGVTSALSITPSGGVSAVQHIRGGGPSSGSGGGSAIGGDAPSGQGNQTGGGGGGGAVIGNEPGFNRPTSHSGSWTTPANAYDETDGTYATDASSATVDFLNMGFSVPSNNTITGIEVKLELSGTTAAGSISAQLSWDGASLTSSKSSGTLTTTDAVVTLGSPSDTWGRTWAPSEFNNGNFELRLTGVPSSNTVRVDAIQVKINYIAGGGGGGGGGEI